MEELGPDGERGMMSRYRYLLCIADGCADEPVTALDGRTPLEAAGLPVLNQLAERAEVGRAVTIPVGMPPGSDVGIMAILGYDPRRHHQGRAALEAAGMRVPVSPDQVVYRCNLVTVRGGVMIDSSGGAPHEGLTRHVAAMLNKRFAGTGLQFHPGDDFRLIMLAPEEVGEAVCVPPHDLIGRPVIPPAGRAASVLDEVMDFSRVMLGACPGAATQIWPWGAGKPTVLPPLTTRHGIRAEVITGTDIVRGLGTLAAMNVPHVPGANGRTDTSYEAKARAAIRAFDAGADLVVVHVEATDAAGHAGDVEAKVAALRSWDGRLLAPVCADLARRGPWRMLFLPDHPTPVARRTHTADPVPYVLRDSERRGPGGRYSERVALESPAVDAATLMHRLLIPE